MVATFAPLRDMQKKSALFQGLIDSAVNTLLRVSHEVIPCVLVYRNKREKDSGCFLLVLLVGRDLVLSPLSAQISL
jgi:hypothetical protein